MPEIKNKLTIMLVTGNNAPIPDVLGGGSERLVTMLADQNEKNNRARFIIISPDNTLAMERSLLYQNSSFIYMRKNSLPLKIRNAAALLRTHVFGSRILKKGYYSNILKYTESEKIDIAVDENGYVPEWKYISDALGKEKTLAHIHWNVNPSAQGVDGLYGGIIGVSSYVADSWLQNSNDAAIKKMVVYSAVNEQRFCIPKDVNELSSVRMRYGISKDCIVFIYCGRLSAQKGVSELIHAFMSVPDANIALLIVGGSYLINSKETAYEKACKRIAANDKRIHFTGYIENSQLYQYYKAADVQVIPTIIEEAAGLVAIEGMLMGLPIIAADSGGLPEYLSEKCALIVDKNTTLEKKLAE